MRLSLKKILTGWPFLLVAAILWLGQSSCADRKIANDCIDKSKINPEGICTKIYQPVCGCDGKTYGNDCEAEKAGLLNWQKGACPED